MRALFICIVCLFVAASVVETRGGFPPTFSKPDGDWSINPQYVRSGVPMVIQCKASANPPATYYWLRDGMRVEQKPDLITFDSQSGNLTIGKGFESSYDGDYQCIAENIHGKAMTPYLSLRKTRAETFPGKINEQSVTAYATDYFSLKCEDVPISIPAWDFRWDVIVMKDGKVEDTSPIVEDERIAIDRHGTLHILSLKREDERIYSCSLTNTILLISVGSTKNYNLQVLPKTSNERAPLLKYNDDVTVTAGTDAHLTCIFSYYSLTSKLEIIWYHRGEDVGRGRTIVVTTHRDPTRPGELEDKEGEYQCEAKLGASTTGNVRGIVNLKIVEPPQFLPNMTIPTTALPVQQNAVFNCKAQSRHAYADPPVWMVNTVPLLGCLPKFFECKESLPDGYSQCIPESQLCNAFPECSDASDEQNCPITCSEGQVACGDSCIAPTEECASVRCDYPGFLCKDESKCVTENSVCNGRADCPDGSDEQYCSNSNEVVKLNRFRFTSDHTQLTIPKVTINDMMCLQCVISNEFGTSFSSGCLTVIEKISILKGPNSTYDIVPGTNLTIEVNAVTDPQFQNQMKYEWFYYEEHGAPNGGNPGKQPQPTLVAHRLPIPNLGSQFELSLNNKHMVMRFPLVAPTDNNAYDIYYKMKDRIYSVVISHQFDRVEKNFTVNGEELLKPKPDPIVEAASTNLWFIALILAILILFIVVALIVCYMYRNRGGTYPLDKKEHQAGHDPEQELKNNGFNDVGRIDDDYDDKPQGEEASLSESVKPYESDDDPTEEYGGDFDVSKFNEDGSFIGLYGDKKSKYSSEAKEATV